MIRVVDAFDARCQASGLGRFLAAAAETGVVYGTILVSVKFHGSALVWAKKKRAVKAAAKKAAVAPVATAAAKVTP
jgi:hypothetical protein